MHVPLVLFLGTGFERKGLAETLRAWQRILKSHPTTQLIVIGRDADSARWKEMASQLGVNQSTRFLGPRSDPETLLAAADVYVLPTAYDPAANTTLEAMACGLPVVTSAMNGAAEVVEEGRFGTVVSNPVHPDDIAQAIGFWLDQVSQGREGVSHLSRLAALRHPADSGFAKMREIYMSVTAEPALTSS